MEPAIYEKDVLLIENRSVIKEKLRKGDVVIVKSPKNPNVLLCKRITALSGDRISGLFSSKTIPRGHVWIEGDNSRNSSDSRNFGPIPYGLIQSRAFYKIWPLNDRGYID
ncbi:DgyrCDS14365 [Dimorphilus gyrociliatus]|uniref:IMP2-like protein n=1 Tax=Dimorphilus gyrociliatus TaxID=2664684 RepID=A0A7I8WDC6_9ANNE|nr:DgyrCDS14365 [Dimorphilus gyrociliatus]